MEKKGWKKTAIIFIILSIIAVFGFVLYFFSAGVMAANYDNCLQQCLDSNSCFSFQYNLYNGSCEIIDIKHIEEIVNELLQETNYFQPG